MTRRITMKRFFLASAVLTSQAWAQSFSLDWHSLDGGGSTAAEGPALTVVGTIGQPDAAQAHTAGRLRVMGGFWAVALPRSEERRVGRGCSGRWEPYYS